MADDNHLLHSIKLTDDNPFSTSSAAEQLEFGDEQHDVQVASDGFHSQAMVEPLGSGSSFVPYPSTVPTPGRGLSDERPLGSNEQLQRVVADRLSRPGADGAYAAPDGSDGVGMVAALPPVQQPRAAPAALKVSVHSPTKVSGPGLVPGVDDSHMVYAVSTVTSLPGYAASSMTVSRRFRDVVDLSDLLQLLYPGCFVPVRPNKDVIASRRNDPDFIKARAAAIERFLNKLAAHPVLGPSTELRAFLQVEGELRRSVAWRSLWPVVPGILSGTAKFLRKVVGVERRAPSVTEVSHRAVANRDMFLMVRERLMALRGQVEGEELNTPEEARLRGEATKLEELHKELRTMCTKASELLRVMRDLGEVAGDLGVVLMDIHRFEDKYKAPVGPPCGVAGQGGLKFFNLTKGAAGHMLGSLQQLHDTQHFMPAVFEALHQREQALLTVTTLSADYNSKRRALADFPLDSTPKRREALQQDISMLEQSLVAARAEYRRVLDRNMTDCELFHLQRYADFSAMLQQFLIVQKAYAEQARDVWVDVARTLGADKAAIAAAGMDPTINTAANNIYLM